MNYSPGIPYLLYLLVLILSLDILSPFTADVCNGIFNQIQHSLNTTSFLVQLSFIAFTVAQTFSQIAFTAFIHYTLHWKYRYSFCITLGLILYIAASLLCAISTQSPLMLIIGRSLQGIGAGFAVLINHELSRSFYPSLTTYLQYRYFRALTLLRQQTRDSFQRETTPYGANDHHAYSSLIDGAAEEEAQAIATWIDIAIFVVTVIRGVFGIASAAPFGSVITMETSKWQNVFWMLSIYGIFTGILFVPLFCWKPCRFEIEKQQLDVLGIVGRGDQGTMGMVQGDMSHSYDADHGIIKHHEMDQDQEQYLLTRATTNTSNTSMTNNTNNSVTASLGTVTTATKSKISVFVIGSPQSTGKQSVESPPTLINSQSPASSKQRLHSQTLKTKTHRLSEIDKYENGSSLLSDQTALSAVSFMTDPFHSIATLQGLQRRRTTTTATTFDLLRAQSMATCNRNRIHSAMDGIDGNMKEYRFWTEFVTNSMQIFLCDPQSLVLLISLSTGYCGVLLILSEMTFVLEGESGGTTVTNGLVIGGMVLSLVTGNVISGYLGNRPWILLFIHCAIFGVLSVIAMLPMTEWNGHFQMDFGAQIHSDWTYIVVFLYVFIFGLFAPTITTLLGLSTECPLGLVLQIIQFWRNLLGAIVVIAVLANRESVNPIHRNFLHCVLAVCGTVIFLMGFSILMPLRCCVHSRTIYGDLDQALLRNDTAEIK